jgi:glutathione S-transferase
MIKLYHLDPVTDFLGGARNGAKVMIALRDLAIPHEVVYISRRYDMRDPASKFCRDVNPWGTVPVLDDDGFILRESAAILRYLAEIAPQQTLWPRAAKPRALVDQWLTWECAMLVPSLLNVVRLGCYDGVDKTDDIADAQSRHADKLATTPGMRDAEAAWHRNVKLLDDALRNRDFVAGDYSLADIALGCAAPIGTIFGMSLMEYPNVAAWLERLGRRASWSEEKTFTLDIADGKRAGLIACSEGERARIPKRVWAAA